MIKKILNSPIMSKDFSEKTLEEIILENQCLIGWHGFPPLFENTLSQFKLPSGKIIDIFSFQIIEDMLFVKIFELKRDDLFIDHLIQMHDYVTEVYSTAFANFSNVHIEKYLIGKAVNEKLQKIRINSIL